jgi:hypothetical protein
MDCTHSNATITIRHSVDRDYGVNGEPGPERLQPDGRLTYFCPSCGQSGTGNANGDGLSMPRWVLAVVENVPVVR